METAILVIASILSVILILLIAIQEPKGEGLGAIGGMASIFHGASPRQKLLDRLIMIVGIAFAVVLLFAGWLYK